MFLGQQLNTLDSKARLTIPAKYRELSAPALVVTRHPSEVCLIAMTIVEWTRFAEKLNALPMVDDDSALLRRVIYGAAEELRLDGQGRVLLSQRLREYAHIENELLVVGVGTHMEIWNPAAWSDVERKFAEADMHRNAFRALGI